MNEKNFSQIVKNYLVEYQDHRKYEELNNLYTELNKLDKVAIVKIFRLLEYVEQFKPEKTFQDFLLADIKEVLKAHKINNKFLGYSPLIGFIFNYYIYINEFGNNQKLEKLKKQLAKELTLYTTIREHCTLIVVRKFNRLARMRINSKKHNIANMLISEKRKQKLKNDIRNLYKRKIHNDTSTILFIKILYEKKILSLNTANQVAKKIFDNKIYIDEKKITQQEVNNLYENINSLELKILLKGQ